MAKKKDINRMSVEKEFANIFNEIGKQDFKSQAELENYLNNLMGKKIESTPMGESKKEQAQDLIYQAYDLPISEGKKLIAKAMKLDPDNADSYIYFAEIEPDINKSIDFYEIAVETGKKSLGKKMFIDNKGHFWGIFETRPYMRARAGLADCLQALGENDKAIHEYQEMLELNPNDNQGVRYLLATLLLKQNNNKDYENLLKEFEDDASAVWIYNLALYSFKKEGVSKNSENTLLEAFRCNQHVVDYMLGNKKMPEELPEYIGRGDENEAIACVKDTWSLWDKTKGAFDWLYDFKQKRQLMN